MKKKIQLFLYAMPFCAMIVFGFAGTAHALDVQDPTGGTNPVYGGCSVASYPQGIDQVTCVAKNVFNMLLGISLTAAVIALMLTGIMYMTSAGDTNRAGMAKKYFTYTVYGIAAIAGARLVVSMAEYIASLSTTMH